MTKDAGPAHHEVRDGSRVLRFAGELLATVSSRRVGAERWSEVSLYLLPDGGYVIAKSGYSTVTHTEDCPKVKASMPTWVDAREEHSLPRTACEICQPHLMLPDPQYRMERIRHRALVAEDAEMAVAVLLEERERPPALIRRLLQTAAMTDHALRDATRTTLR